MAARDGRFREIHGDIGMCWDDKFYAIDCLVVSYSAVRHRTTCHLGIFQRDFGHFIRHDSERQNRTPIHGVDATEPLEVGTASWSSISK